MTEKLVVKGIYQSEALGPVLIGIYHEPSRGLFLNVGYDMAGLGQEHLDINRHRAETVGKLAEEIRAGLEKKHFTLSKPNDAMLDEDVTDEPDNLNFAWKINLGAGQDVQRLVAAFGEVVEPAAQRMGLSRLSFHAAEQPASGYSEANGFAPGDSHANRRNAGVLHAAKAVRQ